MSGVVQMRRPWSPLLMTLAVIGTLSLFIYYSYSLAERMVERYTPLIDATMELKLEATTAHLWFEESLLGEREDEIEAARQKLQQADWYARAMLEGGENSEGRFIPLEDRTLRIHIQHVRERLSEFDKLLELRWAASREDGTGEEYESRFFNVFASFIDEADLVETRLQQLTEEAMADFRLTQHLLLGLTLLLGVGMIYSLSTYNRRHHEQMMVLDAANRELHTEMELRKRAEAVLKRQATTDMLTGIANRHHMSQLLHEEIARAKRYDLPFTVMMFDIDHFKSINDSYGHDRGDEVLKEVAARVAKVLRESDRIARWGGEEFLVLLPATELGGALELAERCRSVLSVEPFEEAGKVSASFGIALYDGAESLRTLLQRTDDALYRAKEAGRNRVEVA